MKNRREFLTGIGAFVGTALLSGCGGGNDSVDTVSKTQSKASNAMTPTSASGTSIPPAKSIIDNLGNTWSVQNQVIYLNGVADQRTYNVTLLLWLNNMLYHQGTHDQFYQWVGSTWIACMNPLTLHANPPFTKGMFYGVNGHYDYAMYLLATLVSILQTLGCSSYRCGYENSQASLNALVSIAQAFQQAGLTLLVVIDQHLTDNSGNLWSSESVAYQQGYQTGVLVARALAPYNVRYYECGNENTRDSHIIYNPAYMGTRITDYNNTNWPILRGVSLGLRDGVKSVMANAICGMNFCVADIAASDMLWFGTQPDGTANHPMMRWDVTTWHNYEVYGNIFNISQDGDGAVEPHFNLPAYCKAKYGVPFIITEWSANPEDSQSNRATYITQKMTDYYNNRYDQSIDSIMYYELDSGDSTWGLMVNGVPNEQPYNAMKNFIASHPDV